MRHLAFVLAGFLTFSCQSVEKLSPPEPEPVLVDLATWGEEVFELPPGFAPHLPAGREILLFPPGWLLPETEDYWSYVFIMEMEAANLDAQRLGELFEHYYDGLIGGVAEGKSFDVPPDPARVTFRHERDNRYTGTVKTYDAFGVGSELTLYMILEVETKNATTSILRIQASPIAPGTSAIWSSLRQAVDSLKFDSLTSPNYS
ncbi:MAG: hypothetical protein ACI87A_003370 [Planctomycetota bacterium]|jgi:hypothetical protein